MKNLARDTIGEILELGKSTAKTTAKQIGQTFSPLKLAEKAVGIERPDDSSDNNEKQEKNHTPLDTKRLEEKYKQNEEIKLKSLKQRLFQQIKTEEKRIWEEKKMQEQRKKQLEEQEKKRKEEEEKKKKEQEELVVPRGKVRRSIFSFKRKLKSKFAEFRAGSGKS